MELTELAQNYFGNTRSGSLAGPVGLLLIVLLAVTTVLLIRNMNARIRRLPERFGGPGAGAGRPGPGAESAPGRDPGAEPTAGPGGDGESQNG